MTSASPAASPFESDLSLAVDGRSLARNASSLFVGQAIGMVVPLLTIPYLARVLGPAAWGPVLAAQAFGYWLILVLEFGFELSGTRAVARTRAAPERLADVVQGIQSAKALLIVATLPIVLIAVAVVPALHHHPRLIGWALAFAILRGASPLWFFQGIERVHGAVAVDTLTRAAAALGVFAFVRQAGDGWRVLALQAVFAGVALVILTAWLGRRVPLRVPRSADARRALREGSTVFACRAWSGLYIQGNALLLAALAAPMTVAFFGGAERIVRAAINMLQPLTQAFLPRVSYLQSADPPAARRMIRRSLVGVGAAGLAAGVLAFFGAPLLVRLLLGAGYESAVPVLRVLGLLPALVAVNTVLGIYWALPFGRDRSFLASIIAAGVSNVVLAVVLVPRFGALGMAAAAITAEVIVLLVLGTLYYKTAGGRE